MSYRALGISQYDVQHDYTDFNAPKTILGPYTAARLVERKFPGLTYDFWGFERLWVELERPESEVRNALALHFQKLRGFHHPPYAASSSPADAEALAWRQVQPLIDGLVAARRISPASSVEALQAANLFSAMIVAPKAAPKDDGVLFANMLSGVGGAPGGSLGEPSNLANAGASAVVDAATAPLHDLFAEAYATAGTGSMRVFAGAGMVYLDMFKALAGLEIANGIMAGLAALGAVSQAFSLLVSVANLSVAVATIGTASLAASTMAAIAAVAMPVMIVALAVLAMAMTVITGDQQKERDWANLRRSGLFEVVQGYAPVTPTGKKASVRPIDMFELYALPEQSRPNFGPVARPSVASSLAAFDRPELRANWLVNVAPIPERELRQLRNLRIAISTNRYGDVASALLWPLYVDLMAAQLTRGRLRYLTSLEIGKLAASQYPWKPVRPSPESRVDGVQRDWSWAVAARYGQLGWLKPEKLPDLSDDFYVYNAKPQLLEADGMAGRLAAARGPDRETVVKLLRDWTAKQGKLSLSEKQAAEAVARLRAFYASGSFKKVKLTLSVASDAAKKRTKKPAATVVRETSYGWWIAGALLVASIGGAVYLKRHPAARGKLNAGWQRAKLKASDLRGKLRRRR